MYIARVGNVMRNVMIDSIIVSAIVSIIGVFSAQIQSRRTVGECGRHYSKVRGGDLHFSAC